MSVLIKGMEMPTSCRECSLYLQSMDSERNVYENCAVTAKSYNWGLTTRPSDCPLIHVPPHGRLIDADALREDWHENGENEYVYDTNDFLESIDSVPTIIEAERQ